MKKHILTTVPNKKGYHSFKVYSLDEDLKKAKTYFLIRIFPSVEALRKQHFAETQQFNPEQSNLPGNTNRKAYGGIGGYTISAPQKKLKNAFGVQVSTGNKELNQNLLAIINLAKDYMIEPLAHEATHALFRLIERKTNLVVLDNENWLHGEEWVAYNMGHLVTEIVDYMSQHVYKRS